jgi:hypothetical protein
MGQDLNRGADAAGHVDDSWKYLVLKIPSARLDLHESGTNGNALKMTSTSIGYLFFNFTLKHLKRIQSSETLHAKMNPTSCLFRSRFA